MPAIRQTEEFLKLASGMGRFDLAKGSPQSQVVGDFENTAGHQGRSQ
jgi:hypothetical protein